MKGIPVVIIGSTRSGTKYMSKVFARAGLSVGHEKFLRNGISSFAIAAGYRLIGPKFGRGGSIRNLHRVYRDFRIIHLVRNPIDAISSMQTEDAFVPSILDEYGTTTLWRTMRYWYLWNCMAEQLAVARFRVEEIEDNFKTILQLLKYRRKQKRITPEWFVNRQENTREGQYVKRTWDDLCAEDEFLCDRIWDKSREYGY